MRRAAGLSVALLVVTLAAYAPVARHGFVDFDDDEYVTQNVHVRRGPTREGVVWAFTSRHAANWHPVTWLSHMVDCGLFGLNPGPHHLVSVALHATAAAVLLRFLAAATGAVWPSAFVAAVFAIHPLRVESVAWIAERKDVLAGLFWMLALSVYLAWVRRGGAGRYGLLVGLFALALMAKPMVVTLPFVLLLLDWWPLGRVARVGAGRLVVEKLPLLVLALAASVVTVVAQRAAGAVAALATLPLGTRIANALVSYVAYVGMTVWPAGLAVFYPPRPPLAAWEVIGSALLLGTATAAAVLARRRAPWALVGWLWYLGTLVPVIGLVKVGEQALADRFTYLPGIGLAIVVAWGVPAVLGDRREARVAIPVAATAALALSAALTARQLAFWRNSETLFRRALAVTDGNYVAENNLGTTLLALGRRDEAMTRCLEAVRLRPAYAKAHVNVGMMLAARGERAAAIDHYRAAIASEPGQPGAHYDLGLALAEDGRLDDAIAEYREAVRLDPDYARAYSNLGWALAAAGRLEDAVGAYRAAIRIDPTLAVAHNNLGVTLEDLGRIDEAVAEYEAGTRLQPGDPQAHFNLASALAGNGRPAEAIPHYEATVRLRPSAADVLAALAAAYARVGRFPDAVAAGERAVAVARENGQDELAGTVAARLPLYRAGRAPP